ncbi:MAG TPA: PHB depolymerase family esterase [Bacteroidia bacterium]|jgi:polyhydroxybutyrate depolymerase|nr:PHB depolymerase family esterase [Bacteroidia bacterium]
MRNKYISRITFILFSWLSGSALLAQTSISDTLSFGGLKRDYRIYIPKIYKSGTAVPLVLNLHGLTSNAQQQEAYANFQPIADTANFIIVSPNGTGSPRGWNNFGPLGTGVDDLGFLSALIDKISASYSIDKNRVYSTGMSNGGFMSYDLACFLNTRIAAIASVTGSMITSHFKACNVKRPTPVMEIHGTADNTVPYNGGGSLSFTPIDTLVSFWVKLNKCNAPVVTNLPDVNKNDGSTVIHYVYDHGQNNTSVELYKVVGGGHAWPGAPFNLSGTNQDFSASNEIWRFFSKYRLDVATAIDENDASAKEIQVFPNPADNGFYLNLPAEQGNYSVTILNSLGQEVANYSGQSKLSFISRENLPAGLYFIRVQGPEQCFNTRVLFN